MRKSLIAGVRRSVGDVKKGAAGEAVANRTERDLPLIWVMIGVLATGVVTFFIYIFFTQNAVGAALVARALCAR